MNVHASEKWFLGKKVDQLDFPLHSSWLSIDPYPLGLAKHASQYQPLSDTWARFWTHTTEHFLFSNFISALDMCIMPTKLAGNEDCPPDNANVPAKNCVAKYITAESCKAAGGTWTKFVTNYLEKTDGNLSNCEAQGDLKLAKGLPYEPHKLSQGSDEQEQYVFLQKTPDVIYAPSTVVNHNGVNMRGKFSSYKWKVPCFPSTTTQRCVIRLR